MLTNALIYRLWCYLPNEREVMTAALAELVFAVVTTCCEDDRIGSCHSGKHVVLLWGMILSYRLQERISWWSMTGSLPTSHPRACLSNIVKYHIYSTTWGRYFWYVISNHDGEPAAQLAEVWLSLDLISKYIERRRLLTSTQTGYILLLL